MASVNKVILIGNLGKEPELRYTHSGEAVTSFPIATSNKIRSITGAIEERTEWHNILLLGRQAEVALEHLQKGSSVYIDGRLQSRKWQDKYGIERQSVEVIAEKLQILGGRGIQFPE